MPIGSIQGGSTNGAIQSAQAIQASSSTTYDPADTNQDGVVSGMEALAYSLEHPELAVLKAAKASSTSGAQNDAVPSLAPYTQNGAVSLTAAAPNGFLDLTA